MIAKKLLDKTGSSCNDLSLSNDGILGCKESDEVDYQFCVAYISFLSLNNLVLIEII